jgi:Putative peptidoglycan binding domain
MKREISLTIIGALIALLSLLGAPAYAGGHGGGGGGGHGGFSGGGHAGFSGGAHFSGGGRAYSGGGSYGGRSYSSGISAGHYSNYGSSNARSQGRIAGRQFATSPSRSGSYYVPRDQSGVSFARKPDIQRRAARGATQPDRTWSRLNAFNKQHLDPQDAQRLRNWQGKASGYAEAKRHHQEHWQDRHHHDHDWWRHHCDAIVFVGGGFWGWYDGWWYPAWGYDPYYSSYDYNGPIYGYDGLRPDEVIANVQAALQQLGYYVYAVDGVLGTATETAIADYQRDNGLPVTGAIDPATVRLLGLSG